MLHAEQYISHPWYVKPTWASRWGPSAWMVRVLGGVLPGDGGDSYKPQGYRISELGPQALEAKGKDEMEVTRAILADNARSGCPFTAW
jgi:hypothetical protein